jgi:hypothetical protein
MSKSRGYEWNDGFGDTFRVENGMLKITYAKYDRNQTL